MSIGSATIGTSMGFFSRLGPYSSIAKNITKVFFGSKGVANYETKSLKPVFALRLLKHAVGGGIMFDFIKRNADEVFIIFRINFQNLLGEVTTHCTDFDYQFIC